VPAFERSSTPFRHHTRPSACSRPSTPHRGLQQSQVDRVEWLTMPEAGTAASALQGGEVDWWESPPPDLSPMLQADKRLMTRVIDKTGVVPMLRFNSLQPPFDNPGVRQAVQVAARQQEFMEAFSSDRTQWRDGVGLFTLGTPMATKAGMERLNGPANLDAARRAITTAGYRGERVVVMQPTDHPVNNVMAAVGADLFKRLGLNVDIQAMDAGTMFQRRANREGIDKGGWSAFPSMVGGTDSLNPAVSFLARGNGTDAWYGWPTIPKLEAARSAWFQAPDLATQKACCAGMQVALLDNAPHLHLGQILQPTSYRSNISGVLDGIPKFWNVTKG
jgi:peptide/nickel transport system substrate-binding protein